MTPTNNKGCHVLGFLFFVLLDFLPLCRSSARIMFMLSLVRSYHIQDTQLGHAETHIKASRNIIVVIVNERSRLAATR
jgi:hypothetical protein